MNIVEIKAKRPCIDEVLRYMRAGKKPDSEIVRCTEGAIEKIFSVTNARGCYIKCELELADEGIIKLGAIEIQSKSLYERLSGCAEAYIFAVTVGSEVDRVIRFESAKSSLLGLCADAAGSAMVESACDELNEQINCICQREGKITKTRFSAGYGDLSVEYQREICSLLDTKKNIGVALSDGGMMMPTKSVTAIIGVY